MNNINVLNTLKSSLVATLIVVMLLVFSFFNLEPTVGRAITSNFVVSQQITNEISFIATTTNTTMVGSIAGLTGGYATGTNRTVVNTNNPTGYNMTVAFPTTTSGRAMQASSTAYIDDYLPAGGAPTSTDFTFTDPTAGTESRFGYTVRASTSGEVSSYFMNNSSACNAGSTETDNRCWARPSTTPVMIINSIAPNSSSTSTIKFRSLYQVTHHQHYQRRSITLPVH